MSVCYVCVYITLSFVLWIIGCPFVPFHLAIVLSVCFLFVIFLNFIYGLWLPLWYSQTLHTEICTGNNNDNNTLFTKSNTAYRNIYIQSIQEYIHSGA
jgi:hypothetical protein